MKNIFIILLSLFYTQIQAQTIKQKEVSDIQKFYALFAEAEIEVLHVYALGRVPGDIIAESLYPFKGKEIDTSLHPLLKDLLFIDEDTRLFAVYRFYLTKDVEGLIVRSFRDPEHRIYCLAYYSESKTLLLSRELAYMYGYEGSVGALESWFVDVNRDGIKDIVSRSWSESYNVSDGSMVSDDSTYVSVWEEGSLTNISINDTLLKANLALDFPFYTAPGFSYNREDELFKYICASKMINCDDSETRIYWNITLNSYADLQSAKKEMKRVQSHFGAVNKYKINKGNFEILKYKDRFIITLSGFDTKNEAEIASKELNRQLKVVGRVEDLRKKCTSISYNSEGFYECVE